ncbi:Os05g0109200 [Oryza sativa Japonica Group]|uniref:Os05g0109200 protein n=3 Tax=Oryza TaxID=4527 RepID=B9FM30_ORYSJ|nr:hypothetical protein OsJ_16843 [Oryza sativa Japonica Group]BAS91904.1 Os05g0109200 [Oryza sativa Japonica Group]
MPLLSIGVGTRLGISGKRWRGGERERRWRDGARCRSSRVVGTMVTGANNLTDTDMGRHYPCPSRPIAIPRDSGDGSRLGHLLLTKAASASTSPRHRCLRLLSHRPKWGGAANKEDAASCSGLSFLLPTHQPRSLPPAASSTPLPHHHPAGATAGWRNSALV